jgi:hypothetical protein
LGSSVTTRVIQWATGPVGSVQLAEVIDNPEFDLVGLFVYSPDKVGVDAGALVGRPDTGIVATDDKAAILALEPRLLRRLGVVVRDRLGRRHRGRGLGLLIGY